MSGRPFGGRTKTSGQGRKAGVPNKFNADIKAMVLGALNDVGGQRYLARQAEQNPVAFIGLVGKILPLQLTGQNGAPLKVDFRWADDRPVVTLDASALELEATPTDDNQRLKDPKIDVC